MSTYLNNIRAKADQYYDAIPNETIQAAGKSFVVSFGVSLLLTQNPQYALESGIIAATCSLVLNVTKPIFKDIWNSNIESKLQFIARVSIITSAVACTMGKVMYVRSYAVIALLTIAAQFAQGMEKVNMKNADTYIAI